jgi:hypothetical protein
MSQTISAMPFDKFIASEFMKFHATRQAPETSSPIEHFARTADSLPAVAEPVWYPCHAGSRRAQSTSIRFFAPRHLIG